ncbi:MAG: N-acetyltransferase [Actinomycetota bacterium]
MSGGFVPESFVPPRSFQGPGFRLEPLGPEHNRRDYEAWSSSMDHIRTTPGEWGKWPHPMTLEDNLADLEEHAREFQERQAFTYSILDGDDVIGCLYIYPDSDGDTDAYVSSWVTESRAEMDTVVWRAVTDWLNREWPFRQFRYADRTG